MEAAAIDEVQAHRLSAPDRGVEQSLILIDPPQREQAPNDDSGIEEIRQRLTGPRGVFKREHAEFRVPHVVHQKTRTAPGGIEMLAVARAPVQKRQGAYAVACNFS